MDKKISAVAGIIAKAVFASLIYMIEHDGRMDFVYFTSEETDEDMLYDIQNSAQSMLECDVGILDLRYFSDFDRYNLLHNSKIVYCENPALPKIVQLKAIENLKSMLKNKNEMLERKESIGCFYLQ